MIDPSLLGIQVPSAATTQVFPQTLPAQQGSDAARFQNLLNGLGSNSNTVGSVQDQPVLQRVDQSSSTSESSANFKENLISQVSSMDQSYHSLMDQLRNRPSFSEYLESYQGNASPPLRTYPEVPATAGGNDAETRMSNLVEKMKKDNVAGLDYQRDIAGWAMNFQMWSSSVELISSMVSQVSKGFQTLFRASG